MNKILSCLLVGTMLTAGSMASAFDVDLTCNFTAYNVNKKTSKTGEVRIVLSDDNVSTKSYSYSFRLDSDNDAKESRPGSGIYSSHDVDAKNKAFFYVKEDKYVIYPNNGIAKAAWLTVNRLTGKLTGSYVGVKDLESLSGYCNKTQVRF